MTRPDEEHFCERCQRQVAVRRQPLDVTAQVVFSVFTLGLWLPFWLLMWLASPVVCLECGQKIDSPKTRGEDPHGA